MTTEPIRADYFVIGTQLKQTVPRSWLSASISLVHSILFVFYSVFKLRAYRKSTISAIAKKALQPRGLEMSNRTTTLERRDDITGDVASTSLSLLDSCFCKSTLYTRHLLLGISITKANPLVDQAYYILQVTQ